MPWKQNGRPVHCIVNYMYILTHKLVSPSDKLKVARAPSITFSFSNMYTTGILTVTYIYHIHTDMRYTMYLSEVVIYWFNINSHIVSGIFYAITDCKYYCARSQFRFISCIAIPAQKQKLEINKPIIFDYLDERRTFS